ncbi:saposin containing protein [Schistosoma mansoni]|uniref:LGG n=2 Tax=Schistosoma mansoni TaxID=6183 RepID=Q26536_SCHMA|nr:saposin containing protein [Schistosoma mansoni]AAB81008.1 LGG [Schistosoma mansoni]|eukprot:XP_018650090.1 saposin containing protein [Schistosoma mansoni]
MFGFFILTIFCITGFVTSINQPELEFGYKDVACNLLELAQEKSLQIMKEEQFIGNMVEYLVSITCDNVKDLNKRLQCKTSMATEARILVQYFIEFIESYRLKTMLNWCQSTLERPQYGNSSFLCSTCEMAVAYLKTFSKSEEAKAIVHQAVDKICSLTGSFEVQCSFLGGMFIDKYIDTISTMDPDSACMTMHMCS